MHLNMQLVSTSVGTPLYIYVYIMHILQILFKKKNQNNDMR